MNRQINTRREWFIVKYHHNNRCYFLSRMLNCTCLICAVCIDMSNLLFFTNSKFISCRLLELCYTSRAAFSLPMAPQCVSHCDVKDTVVAALWRHREQCICNNIAFPLVETFKLLINVNEWIAHVQDKHFTTPRNQFPYPEVLCRNQKCRIILRYLIRYSINVTWVNFNPIMDK